MLYTLINLLWTLKVNNNVASSVKLCGMNPTYYISSGDHVTISLQGDASAQRMPIQKRFSLRIGVNNSSSVFKNIRCLTDFC